MNGTFKIPIWIHPQANPDDNWNNVATLDIKHVKTKDINTWWWWKLTRFLFTAKWHIRLERYIQINCIVSSRTNMSATTLAKLHYFTLENLLHILCLSASVIYVNQKASAFSSFFLFSQNLATHIFYIIMGPNWNNLDSNTKFVSKNNDLEHMHTSLIF